MAQEGEITRADGSSGQSWPGPVRCGYTRQMGILGASQTPTPLSGREWQGAQSLQGVAELGFPGPALGKMQRQAACLAGDASGQGEETPSEGLGGHDPLTEADAGGPPAQVMRDDLDGQPGGVGGEAPRGEVIEPHAILQVADGVLYLGVAAVVSLQFQGVSLPVGDAGVIAVVGEQQSYARARPVQRRLTGESAHGCMLMARRVVRTKADWRLVRIARRTAWSGSHTTASLVTPRPGRSRWGEWLPSVAPSGDTPTRHWQRR